MSWLSVLINLMHPCSKKVLFLSFKIKSYWPQTFVILKTLLSFFVRIFISGVAANAIVLSVWRPPSWPSISGTMRGTAGPSWSWWRMGLNQRFWLKWVKDLIPTFPVTISAQPPSELLHNMSRNPLQNPSHFICLCLLVKFKMFKSDTSKKCLLLKKYMQCYISMDAEWTHIMVWTASARPDVKLGTMACLFVFWLWLVYFANENACV